MNSQFVCFLVALVVSSDMQARLLYDAVRSVRRTGLKKITKGPNKVPGQEK